jgi:hypothetical protein
MVQVIGFPNTFLIGSGSYTLYVGNAALTSCTPSGSAANDWLNSNSHSIGLITVMLCSLLVEHHLDAAGTIWQSDMVWVTKSNAFIGLAQLHFVS